MPAVAAVKADVPLPFRTPVSVVAPVPPLATLSVPANVTAPVVAVFGVNPVEPALKDATVLDVVANVPLVGNVTLVLPVNVPVKVYAPLSVTLPPIVIVLEPLLTPVPPDAPPRVPDSVIAPVVEEPGDKPDKLVWKDVTPAEIAAQDVFVPFVVR